MNIGLCSVLYVIGYLTHSKFVTLDINTQTVSSLSYILEYAVRNDSMVSSLHLKPKDWIDRVIFKK